MISAVAVWVVFAVLLHARFRPEMRGRRVMLLTLVAFVSLAIATIGVDLLHISSHGVPRLREPAVEAAPQAASAPAALLAGRGA